jgi:predicted HD superfamily hydrolase involved in NAD metabolism
MATVTSIATKLRAAVEALAPRLRDHILRVEAEAMSLSRVYGQDPQRASIAALGHDLVRHKNDDELLELAKRYDIDPDAVERESPILLHGPIAAGMLVRDFDLDDREVIAGVDCHTTARPGMTMIEKMLFIADKIEPNKLKRGGALQGVYDLRTTDLDAAIVRFLDLRIEEALAGAAYSTNVSKSKAALSWSLAARPLRLSGGATGRGNSRLDPWALAYSVIPFALPPSGARTKILSPCGDPR